MKKALSTIYLMIFTALLLVPSAGMLIKGPSESENGEETVFPSVSTIDGAILPEMGEWFESHFAFRQEFVSAYSFISETIFGTSPVSGVVTGSDGWLFYEDTVPDYQRTNILTDRQIHNTVRHLELIDEYCEENGMDFLFVIAPNKNTLYPEYMPYYIAAGEGPSNRDLIREALNDSSVDYIDFGINDTFTDPDAVYYFRRDSHWNNMGAAIASDAMLQALNIAHHSYMNDPFTGVDEHMGDLEQMIHPSSVVPETDVFFETMPQFTYDAPVESNYDFRIGTKGSGEMNLLMYRDSFGTALLPFMAEPFSHAFFSRSNSCQITDISSQQPDILIMEKVERFLDQLCTSPSRIPAPSRILPGAAIEIEAEDFTTAEAGDYITVTGMLPEGSYEADTIIYIVCGDLCFEAFPVSDIQEGSEGFQALLEKNLVSTDNIRVFIA